MTENLKTIRKVVPRAHWTPGSGISGESWRGKYHNIYLWVEQDREGDWRWYIQRDQGCGGLDTQAQSAEVGFRSALLCVTDLVRAIKREAAIFTALVAPKGKKPEPAGEQ